MKPFISALGPMMARYVTLKQALGRGFAEPCAVLHSLDQYLVEGRMADLTADTFAAWSTTLSHLMPGVRRRRFETIRNFCLYRRRTDAACYVPDPALFPVRHRRVHPYVFTDADIIRVLVAAKKLERTDGSPLRPDVFRLVVVLLYTTGIRRGELTRFSVGDYDRRDATLLVRQSKFHKSRYVPLSADGVHEIEHYLQVRRAHRQPAAPETPLLWNRYAGGRTYTGTGVREGLRSLFRMAHVHKPDGTLPRVHDFRHGFAIRALLRWYEAGEDLHAKLPLLATYMGHVSIVSTAYYLPFIEPLAAAASARFAQRCGGLITASPEPAGGAS
jgi:integrase/recombinase XerD